jgi:hypothetical protein
MDATPHCTKRKTPRKRTLWPRRRVAEKLAEFHRLESPWTSCRRIAAKVKVPDRTLRHWTRREWVLRHNSRWPRIIHQFLESPHGLDFLHHLLVAAHLVFVQANDAGIRNLCCFLKLSGLDEFIAPSYGAQRAMAEEMESLLVRFGQEEHKRLAAHMPPREITLCEDETFHPQICLVAIEPVSNFLLLEQYAPQRDAATWDHCLDEKLAGLPVTVLQVTSDQSRALIAHAEMHLGAHHSPDLFHVQYDTVRATSAALAGQTRAAIREREAAAEKTASLRGEYAACREQCPQDPLAEVLQQRVQRAEAAEAAAAERVTLCQARQACAKAARQGLSSDYHPVDLATGQPVTADEVRQRLAGRFDALEQIAAEAGLSSHAREKLAKGRRVLDAMQATILFFWTMIATRLEAWHLGEPLREWTRTQLIPGYYLRRVAKKAATAQERQRLRALSEEVLARARSPDGPWGTLPPAVRIELERKAQQCADFFQRSSSCVEGRNGQLSLKHHALHHLSTRKLQTLTVLHNYLVCREDGSTAAERFYGIAPRELLPWLRQHLPLPARRRARRRAVST